MDNVKEGRGRLTDMQIAGSFESLVKEWPDLLALACAVSGYYLLLGTRVDAWLILLGLVWFQRSALTANGEHYAILGLILAITSLSVWLSFKLYQAALGSTEFHWDGPGQPLLIPSRTTHRRTFPKKHAFSYSYLLVGVPVGSQGNANGLISVDVHRSTGSRCSHGRSGNPAWFDVSSDDYLQRGRNPLGLRGKLDSYLKSQGVDPADYPHAYLLTAARFVGYHFNPVSFWFLYSPEKVLSAVILEVNNTFGERRPYLVTRDFDSEAKQPPESPNAAQSESNVLVRIKNAWAKDFHVSPFNSRKGTYSLLASDPLGPGMEDFRGVDITINLSSFRNHTKLVARLFSEGQHINPANVRHFQKIRVLLCWFWVGFATLPRIMKEAAVLFFKRKLHFWYRPEPLSESLARQADPIEAKLEGVFRLYLGDLIARCTSSIIVMYTPSGVAGVAPEIFASKGAATDSSMAENMEIKVLTPVFYSRFVRYAHDLEAICCELTESCTIWVDRQDMLPKVFVKEKMSPPLHASTALDFAYFKCIQHMRQRPERIQRPLTSAERTKSMRSAVDIRDFRMSSMDAFILERADAKAKNMYRSAVIRLLVAERLLWGSTELLGMIELSWRVGVAWVAASLVHLMIRTGIGVS